MEKNLKVNKLTLMFIPDSCAKKWVAITAGFCYFFNGLFWENSEFGFKTLAYTCATTVFLKETMGSTLLLILI